jgi:predicted PurR-regulated permease PerM
VAGAVMCVLAYQTKGWMGVGIFVGLTFLLHKIEAYYLNPRLTARHVHLPGFVLIVSLLAFEHVFGFAGLFLSFPFLFVAGRIRAEWAAQDKGAPAA